MWQNILPLALQPTKLRLDESNTLPVGPPTRSSITVIHRVDLNKEPGGTTCLHYTCTYTSPGRHSALVRTRSYFRIFYTLRLTRTSICTASATPSLAFLPSRVKTLTSCNACLIVCAPTVYTRAVLRRRPGKTNTLNITSNSHSNFSTLCDTV